MALRIPPWGQVLPRVVACVGALLFATGSVLVFMTPSIGTVQDKAIKPEPTAERSTLPEPLVSHDLRFPKTTPSPSPTLSKVVPRKTGKSSPVPTVSRTPVRSDPPPSPIPTPTVKPVTPTPTPKPAPTTVVPTPTPSPTKTVAQISDNERRAQVIYLINQQRAQAGLGTLTISARISDHCQEWAAHLATTKRLVYSSAPDEVIAEGTTIAENVVQQWLNNAIDHDILFNPNLSRVGSGYVNGYWVVQFG